MPGETSRLKLPYPLGTDQVREGAAKAQALAEDIDKALAASGLLLKVSSTSMNAKSGEMVQIGGINQTVTLPEPAVNAIVGVWAWGTNARVNSSGIGIYGDLVTGTNLLVLAQYQHVILQGNGTNWLVVSGEPKREQAYGAQIERAAKVPHIASVTRPAFVVVQGVNPYGNAAMSVTVGGVVIGSADTEHTSPSQVVISFLCPSNVAWEAEGPEKLFSSYLLQ